MSDNTQTDPTNDEIPAEPLLVDQLVDKLFAIDLDHLDIQLEMDALHNGNNWHFIVIPITVLLLMAGMAIGLYLDAMIAGFIGGALLALLAGYAYQLWDKQWREVAIKNVLLRIDEIETKDGFLRWFQPLLARNVYKGMFYKLKKLHVVDIMLYTRAIRRLREKPQDLVRQALIVAHPQLIPIAIDPLTETIDEQQSIENEVEN